MDALAAAAVAGAVAGWGIAIPLGPVGVLIVETGLRHGYRIAFAAGLGAATADLIYASAAAVGGLALAELLQPAARPLRLIGGGALIVLAVARFVRSWREGARVPSASDGSTDAPSPSDGADVPVGSASSLGGPPRLDASDPEARHATTRHAAAARTDRVASAFAAFLGITLLNPLTVAYFAALVVGGQQLLPSASARVVFVGAAFAASLSWQWGLAGLGAGARGRLPARAHTVMAAAGNALVLGLGAWMAAGAMG
ncbi:MAG TPA: LysE family transporter [Egibacteraceae bacterium]|nr:LysE family transporter [Egibacteraceae bacterium]